ncbi:MULTISPECIES: hypothetical protein [Pseudomonas]|uniref:hypothetical protein n=1 Tax=Pseudomonas TaxID=286 RepID=UPI001F284485|nr:MULTISPECIES: hypothetical protein [Pseudomonas]UJW20213.1 hypothetical protein L2Y89_14540 [Pseudomonas juntendi]
MTVAVIFDLFGTLLEIRNRQNPYRQLLRIGAKQGRAASSKDMRAIMAFHGGISEAAEAFGICLSSAELADLECMLELELESSAIHEPHLSHDGAAGYRGISGEQFHGRRAS